MRNLLIRALGSAGIGTVLCATGCSHIPAAAPVNILEANPATKTAQLFITAGYNSNNLWSNFDGYANGRLVVTIPVGYHVVLHFTNDGGIPYDLGVYTADNRVAFPGAGHSEQWLDMNPMAGVLPGDSQTYTFTASTAGTYRIASLLYRFPAHRPTHVALGMWDTLRVVKGGAPSAAVSR